ncbi:MAG: LacI family DNA-binding transcriptional regulator [Lentisphaeria bacterium]|nr:LacI family DNA-binding transcriptional regulator [Lentisphaeria bacterium]
MTAKAKEITNILRHELETGKYEIGKKFPSEHALMSRFKVARATINKITTMLVSEGYLKRGVQGSGTMVCKNSRFPVGRIAYVGPLKHLYYMHMVYGIQAAALENDYMLDIALPSPSMIPQYIEKLENAGIDGLLICGIFPPPVDYKLPIVALDSGLPDVRYGCTVSCDNYKAAFEMAQHVIDKGHREIIIISDVAEVEFTRRKRIEGFSDAMIQAGIKDVENRIFNPHGLVDTNIYLTLKMIFQKYPETTIILTDADDVAYRVINMLKRANMASENVVVTGFGNIYKQNSAIATIEQYPQQIGYTGCVELLKAIKAGCHPSGLIELPAMLVKTELIPKISSDDFDAFENSK